MTKIHSEPSDAVLQLMPPDTELWGNWEIRLQSNQFATHAAGYWEFQQNDPEWEGLITPPDVPYYFLVYAPAQYIRFTDVWSEWCTGDYESTAMAANIPPEDSLIVWKKHGQVRPS